MARLACAALRAFALLLCACVAGGIVASPPSPPALALWPKLAPACITVDVPWASAYSPNLALYNSFMQRALFDALNLSATTALEVLSAGPTGVGSLVNGTAVTYALASASLTQASASAALSTLFQPSGASASPGWKPAYPSVVASLMRLGLPLHLAYGTCAVTAPPPAPPPVAAFKGSVQGQRIAFDVPYAGWKGYAYNAAVQAALAEVLAFTPAAVQVTQVLPATYGGTILVIDLATPTKGNGEGSSPADYVTGTSTEGDGTVNRGMSVQLAYYQFLSLFTNSSATAAKVTGFNTAYGWLARPQLLTALRKYGLQQPVGQPLNAAYFGCAAGAATLPQDCAPY
jgi:hypothetical protein